MINLTSELVTDSASELVIHLIIQNVRVVSPAAQLDALHDVHVVEGKIVALHPPLSPVPEHATIVDATDQVMLPGAIDLACTICDPGREDVETLASTLAAAARGGFTTIVGGPNTTPPTETAEAVRAKVLRLRDEGKNLSSVYGLVSGALSSSNDDQKAPLDLAEIGLMAQAGAALFTNFPAPLDDLAFIRRAQETVAATGRTTLLWGADPSLSQDSAMTESAVSTLLGINGTPAAAEVIRAHAVATLTALTQAPTIFGPVSVAASLDAIDVDNDAIEVGALCCGWSLLLDEEAHRERNYDVNLALEPPLRTTADRQALLAAARNGRVAITSGHRPRAPDEKDVEFGRAKLGGSGLELLLPALVHVGDDAFDGPYLDVTAAAIALAEIPARYLGDVAKHLGSIRVGQPANFVVLSAGNGRLLSTQDLSTACKHSPYLGLRRRSTVELCVASGRVVFARGDSSR